MEAVTPIIIIDNEYVTMWYHTDKQILHHHFHKFIYGKPFRDTLSTGTEAIRKYGARKWLSDDRLNGAITKDDQEWGSKYWFPQTKMAGWRYWAIVQPANIIGELNIKRIAQQYTEQGVVTKYFSDPSEAMTWLESKQ